MDEANTDKSEVLENTETTETGAVETTEAAEPTAEELKVQLDAERKLREETEAKNKQLFERAKKAEAKPAPVVQSDALANKDIIYLAKADIHADDVDEVLELATLKKWDVARAHTYLKPVLDARTEERKTANATQSKGSPRGTAKVSAEEILSTFERSGRMPETDDGMTELFKARRAKLLNEKK